jgi:hypothetical protein
MNRAAAMNVSGRHGSWRRPVLRHRSSYSGYLPPSAEQGRIHGTQNRIDLCD